MATVAFHPVLLDTLRQRRGREMGHFIGGASVASLDGRTFERFNPADARELVAKFALGGAADVDRAVAAAEAAFPSWRATPQPQRGKIIAQAALILAARAEELAQAMTWEVGKAIAEARQEVQRAIGYLEFIAGEGRRLGAETLPSEAPGLNYTQRRPLGVVALITPWNFPVNIPVIKAAPALLAGNTVVLKPSELSPMCGQLLAEVFTEAGVPAGVFNVVQGAEEAGRALVGHEDVRAISFTGSTAVGRDINKRAAERFAKVQLEMGGKNPTIVLADADLDRAATDVAVGGWSVTGQRCNANSLVFVEASVFEAFAAKLKAKAATIRVGPGLDAETAMGPLVELRAIARLEKALAQAKRDGGTVLVGGTRLKEGAMANGHYMGPTLVTGLKPEHMVCRDELFGPVIALVPVSGLDEAIKHANALPYGLSSAIYTQHMGHAMHYTQQVETGLLHLNCATTLSELQMPYGGLKQSGHGGHEMGRYPLEFYTELQAVYWRV